MTKRFPRLWLPDEATGRPAVTGAQHRQQAGGVDNPITMNGRNPVPATNLRGRGASSGADHAANAAVVGPSIPLVPPKKSRVIQSLGKNKASPARLVKLNKILSPDQKTLITEWGWRGMLMVKATEMPVDLSMWVLSCFDPIRSELAIPGTGSIPVDAASYHKVFGLPNKGLPVRYEMETEPISFMNEEYSIQGGSAPDFKQWRKMIQEMGGVANMKFLRAYCAAVIVMEVKKMGVKKNLCVDVYNTSCDFIQIKIDLTSFCFVFVELKKRKLVVMIGELCTDISNRLGSFVQQVGDLEQAEGSAKGACGRVKKRQRAEPTVFVDEDDDDDEDDEDYNAEAGEDEDCDDEDDEDDADEDGDDEDNEDGDDEDGVSKEGPSNSHNNEDDDFEDRATHLEKTPMQSARGFATSGGEDIDMPNIQAPQFFDITEKIYPNSIFMEEIVRSQRVSPAITPPLDQFHRDTAVQNLQAECIALDKLAIRGDKPMQTKQKNGCTS
ncbi:hypothetical protein ACQ4PT_021822 [Festuca glaucescens]